MSITSTHLAPTAQFKQKLWNVFIRELSLEVKRSTGREESLDFERWAKRLATVTKEPLSFLEKVQLAAVMFRSELGNDPAIQIGTAVHKVLDEHDIAI